VRDVLTKTGFYVSEIPRTRGFSFDIIARRDRVLLIAKVLANVDALGETTARELRLVASNLEGSPLLVGARSGSGELQQGVVYNRFEVPILSLATLKEYLEEGIPPFIFSAPGGLYVRLDSEVLRRARDRDISLGRLAEVAHVTRRSIQMYMEGMSATIDAATLLEDFLGEPLVKPIEPLGVPRVPEAEAEPLQTLGEFQRHIVDLLRDLGFNVVPVHRSPFDAITRDQDLIFLAGLEQWERDFLEKAVAVVAVSRVAEKEPVLFVERRSRKAHLKGIPIIEASELQDLDDPGAVEELMEERKG
jgi:putative transcriptional regulator